MRTLPASSIGKPQIYRLARHLGNETRLGLKFEQAQDRAQPSSPTSRTGIEIVEQIIRHRVEPDMP